MVCRAPLQVWEGGGDMCSRGDACWSIWRTKARPPMDWRWFSLVNVKRKASCASSLRTGAEKQSYLLRVALRRRGAFGHGRNGNGLWADRTGEANHT